MARLLFAIVVTLLAVSEREVLGTRLPSVFNACYRDDPKLNSCLLKEGIRVKGTFVKGLPSYGVPSLDPLEVGDIISLPGENGQLRLTNNNAVMKGLSKSDLKHIDIDVQGKTGRIHVFGNFTVLADYVIDGNLLILPIHGKGKCQFRLVNTDLKFKWNWDLFKGPDGLEYSIIKDFTSEYKFGNVKIKMDGLFNNDKALGDSMNQLLNQNWRDLMKEFGPPSIKAVLEKMKSIINTLYSHIPYDDLLPQKPAA